MTKEETLAYTAGIIDADGYIGLMRRYYAKKDKKFYVPCVKLASTTPIILEYMQSRYGGHIDGWRHFSGTNSKPANMWSIRNRRKVKEFLDDIVKYLVIKKPRAKLVIEFINECGIWRQSTMSEERRVYYYKKMKSLNHRGVATTE